MLVPMRWDSKVRKYMVVKNVFVYTNETSRVISAVSSLFGGIVIGK